MRNFFILIVAFFCSTACVEKTFYLDSKGNDGSEGSLLKPWATLERALTSVQNYLVLHPEKDVKLVVKSGEYSIREPVLIDGSKFEGKLRIEGRGKTKPVFSGEKRLSGWKAVSEDSVLERIPENFRSQILMCDLKSEGITDFGEAVSDTNRINFYCNGRRQYLSRWPNVGDGFIYAGKAVGQIERELSYLNVHNTADGVLEYNDDRVESWSSEIEPCAHGYWHFNWSSDYQPMLIDTLSKTMTLLGNPHYYGYRDGCRFVGINLLCELDTEGEFFLDRSDGILYWYPTEDFSQDRDETAVSMFSGAYMLTLNNCKNLSIENIDFCGGRGGAIQINYCDAVVLEDCAIRRFACDALIVNDSQAFEMDDCVIEELDCAGLRASGGDRQSLKSADFEVKNCVFKNLALFKPTYMPAINFKGCGLLISHNIFDGNASSALRLDGNDVIVEYNEFCNLVQESEDQGGIDVFNDISFRGIVVRYNYWHDIGRKGISEAAAVRFDDIISGVQVYGNVFQNCGTSHFGAVQIHGGKDNIISGNIFFNCSCAVSCSPWDDDLWRTKYAAQKEKIAAVDFFGEVYKSHYQEIVDEATLFENHNRNYLQGNLLVNVPEPFRRSQNCIVDNNRIVDDNDHALSFYLDRDVLRYYGIEDMPFELIGPAKKQNR